MGVHIANVEVTGIDRNNTARIRAVYILSGDVTLSNLPLKGKGETKIIGASLGGGLVQVAMYGQRHGYYIVEIPFSSPEKDYIVQLVVNVPNPENDWYERRDFSFTVQENLVTGTQNNVITDSVGRETEIETQVEVVSEKKKGVRNFIVGFLVVGLIYFAVKK